MAANRTFQSILLQNFLSYGPKSAPLDLAPLNVLIGQNASGKSNLIESIRTLKAASERYLSSTISDGGGIDEFIYKGAEKLNVAQIAAHVEVPDRSEVISHSLWLSAQGQYFRVAGESVTAARDGGDWEPYYTNDGASASAELMMRQPMRNPPNGAGETWTELEHITVEDARESIVSQRNDPDLFPHIAHLFRTYNGIRIYSSFDINGRESLSRPQRPDLPNLFLEENGRNLSLVLSYLDHRGALSSIEQALQTVNEDITRITFDIGGGTILAFVHERGLTSPIPAMRLSEGTLRYLCLLAILHHPEPPPLICIEEPEIGLHPDVISSLAKLLVEASTRTQLIVTTHSTMLVSALHDHPEAIVVCERGPDGTTLERLEPADLAEWLEEYSLGQLWMKGELGGTRW